MAEKACTNCKLITNEKVCPNCGGNQFTTDWFGVVVILNPERSEIAKELGIQYQGRYAIKVR
jgi:DNA-directed RNA polymerase subunit E"